MNVESDQQGRQKPCLPVLLAALLLAEGFRPRGRRGKACYDAGTRPGESTTGRLPAFIDDASGRRSISTVPLQWGQTVTSSRQWDIFLGTCTRWHMPQKIRPHRAHRVMSVVW
jgi:hypothetical protein